MMLMRLSGLHKKAYERPMFTGLDWTVQAGEHHWISAGPAEGKSLLCNLLSQTDVPDAGTIQFSSNASRPFGVVFDTPALISNLSIVQNLALVLDHYHGPSEARARRQEIATLLRPWQMEQTMDLRPVALSRSQAFAVALVRALIARPQMLLWDDAFDCFEPGQHEDILKKINQAMPANCASVFFSRRPCPANPSLTHWNLTQGKLVLIQTGGQS
jgi:ABC-type nitrate/sulfonate/bicarbonate transport system ATPase subunit